MTWPFYSQDYGLRVYFTVNYCTYFNLVARKYLHKRYRDIYFLFVQRAFSKSLCRHTITICHQCIICNSYPVYEPTRTISIFSCCIVMSAVFAQLTVAINSWFLSALAGSVSGFPLLTPVFAARSVALSLVCSARSEKTTAKMSYASSATPRISGVNSFCHWFENILFLKEVQEYAFFKQRPLLVFSFFISPYQD